MKFFIVAAFAVLLTITCFGEGAATNSTTDETKAAKAQDPITGLTDSLVSIKAFFQQII